MDRKKQPEGVKLIRHRRRKRRVVKRRDMFALRGIDLLGSQLAHRLEHVSKYIKRTCRKKRHRLIRIAKKVHWRTVAAILLIVGFLGVIAAGNYVLLTRRTAQQAMKDGLAALQAEQWEQACDSLKVYLHKHPNDLEILVRYAEASLAIQPRTLQHHGVAVGAYLRYLQIKPGDPDISDQLARLCYSIRDYKRVEQVARWRLEIAPGDLQATTWLARAMIGQEERAESLKVLEDLVKRYPQAEDIYGLLIDLVLQEGVETSVDDALAWLDLGVSSNPGSALLRAQRALFYQQIRKDSAAARTDLEVADTLRSTDLRTMIVVTEGWLALGELGRAFAQLKAIETLDRKTLADSQLDLQNLSLVLFSAKAELYLRSGRSQDGVKLADEALHRLSGGGRTMFLPSAVNLYLAGGDIDSARKYVDEYSSAIQHRADRFSQTQLVVLRAAIADTEGKSYLVLNLLEPLLEESPPVGGDQWHGVEHIQVWKLLAQSYSRIRQDRRALVALEKYVLRSFGDWEATLALARACYRANEFTKARQYAEDAERIRPDDLETKLFRIRASYRYMMESVAVPVGGPPTEELLALRQAYPHNVEISLLMAMAYHGQGLYDEAVAELKRAIRECHDPLPAALKLVMLHNEKGQYEQAVQVCQATLPRVDNRAALWLLLAEVHSLARRTDEARRTLDQAVSVLVGKEQLIAQLALVRHLLSHDERQGGIDLLEHLTQKYPQDSRPLLHLLQLPEIQDEVQAAQRMVDQLRAIEGDRGLQWPFAQAQLWLRGDDWRNRVPEITNLLQRCMKADPGWPSPVAVLGDMYEALEKDDQAEEVYRHFFNNYPQEAEVAIRFLSLLDRQLRYIEAGRILDRLPAGLSILNAYRVRAAIARGDYDTAIGELRQRIGTDPQDAVGRVMLAQLIFHHVGDADLAMNLLDEAYALQPDLMMIASSRAMILQAAGQIDEAIAFLDAEVARRNDFPAWLLRADFFSEIGRFDEAEQYYLHMTEFRKSAPTAFERLGELYEKQGKMVQAMQIREAGLEIDPNHIALQRSLIRILVSSGREEDRNRGLTLLEKTLQQRPDDAVLLAIWAT
ncbi:MAG: tetratricopeptide repeat protein, partial [Phycisphaerales bacterium]|nr:tetratricopeptide repeat protein [Phycisphaerales bacterium]